ncbi:uncharacterized protein LOC115684512 isoform X2 [Syzygium oleosum]|uniref:uncharacterized protein LOC115684512 isoform X2 n=1 Tax=Syzygium oleosum TaxID=219896 RepID=UPI0024B8A45F|nr:uncharacterized protein LOC115684512 isoform X2 [Syzygium oleosum]
MDTQDSSILKQSPEVHLDVDSEGRTIDKAFQGGRRPTEEIHVDSTSEETANDKASQDGHKTTRVKPTPVVNEKYRLLFEVAVKGDWKAAERILSHNPKAMTAKVMTVEGDDLTILDIAILVGQDQLVENLVKRFPLESEAFTISALSHATRRGRITGIKELVDKLDKVGEQGGTLALLIATTNAPRQKEVIRYLAMNTKSTPEDDTISNLIRAGHLASRYPGLATTANTRNGSLLEVFTQVKSYYHSGAKLNFWEKCIYQCIPRLVDTSFDNAKDMKMVQGICVNMHDGWTNTTKSISYRDLIHKIGKIAYLMLRATPFIKRIGELKLRHECSLELATLVFKEKKASMETPEILELTSAIVLDAASSGISEIVKLCLENYPELMWDKEFTKKLMEEVVRARHVELFRLINAYNTIPKLRYKFQRNCDLMAAVVEWSPGYVPADVSGSAFLLQREIQWFKILEDRSSPLIKSLKFKMKVKKEKIGPSSERLELELTKERRGKTYWEVFLEQRKDLLKEATQWMKDTSSSCSLVATLIITVVFAAVFTLPGSNDNRTGIPIFLEKGSFMVFAVADALALFSSITATLMFLAILTSRYATEDFLHSLPRKMILGLTFLFLSLAFMLVAFGSALTIVLSERLKWIYIPIALLATIPVIMFAILQLPLYVEMVESTYRPRLYRPVKIWK